MLRLGQAGGPFSLTSYTFGDACTPASVEGLTALPSPNGARYAFTGPCLGKSSTSFLVIASQTGVVQKAVLLSVPDPAMLAARTLAVLDSSLWWLGTYDPDGIPHVAAIRLDGDLVQQAAGAYVGTCTNNSRVEPAFARPSLARSELTELA